MTKQNSSNRSLLSTIVAAIVVIIAAVISLIGGVEHSDNVTPRNCHAGGGCDRSGRGVGHADDDLAAERCWGTAWILAGVLYSPQRQP